MIRNSEQVTEESEPTAHVAEVISQHRATKEKSTRLSRIGADLSMKLGAAEHWPAFLPNAKQGVLLSSERSNKGSPGLISIFQAKEPQNNNEENSRGKPRIVGIMKNKGPNTDSMKSPFQGKRVVRYSDAHHRGTATELSSPLRSNPNAAERFS